jgi:hypothetical protein
MLYSSAAACRFFFFVCYLGLRVDDEISRCGGLSPMAGFFSLFLYLGYPYHRSSLHEADLFLKCICKWISGRLK